MPGRHRGGWTLATGTSQRSGSWPFWLYDVAFSAAVRFFCAALRVLSNQEGRLPTNSFRPSDPGFPRRFGDRSWGQVRGSAGWLRDLRGERALSSRIRVSAGKTKPVSATPPTRW
jgi:hypothetical protein